MTVDMSTTYLGMRLSGPLGVASCEPLTGGISSLRRLEEAGASFVVLPSLFEEEVEHEEMEILRLYEHQTESFAESLTHFPELPEHPSAGRDYLNRVEAAKHAVGIPVIASLNGHSRGGWVRYAKAIEEAGADALELNIYFVPTDPDATASDVERRYLELVAEVRASVSIPLAVKLGPNFTSLPSFARGLVAAGVDGLVLFNRFLEADIDLETLEVTPDLVLSNRHEARVPIRWIAILRDQLTASLAATSGVHRSQGALKLLLAGADVMMMASVLLMKGPGALTTMLDEMRAWLEENEYASVEQMKGSMSRANCPDPEALDRANYMRALRTFTAPPATPAGAED